MRFLISKVNEFELENHVQPNIQKLKLQNPSSISELISISDDFLNEIKDNISTNDCYNRILLNYIVGFYDRFYIEIVDNIHDSFLKNNSIDEFLLLIERLIKYEYQFSTELKGEKVVENLASLINLIPYIYDNVSIINLLITIADKLTDEEYEHENYTWIKKLYSFVMPIFEFFEENNFIHIRDLKFIVEIYSEKLVRSIKTKLRAIQYFIGKEIIDEDSVLDTDQLLLIKKILILKKELLPENLILELISNLALYGAVQRDLIENNTGCLRLFSAIGCIYETLLKVKVKDHFILLSKYEIPWENILRNFLSYKISTENVLKTFLLLLKGIEKSNMNRTQSIKAHYFLYKSEGNQELGLQIIQFILKNVDFCQRVPSYFGTNRNILIELLLIFFSQAEILTSYHLKVEYRNPDEERHYKENFGESILKFFHEFENLMLSKDILFLPKSIQESIYSLYFNLATSDIECVKKSRLINILQFNQSAIVQIINKESNYDFVAIEKLRAPFWWERYATPYREKMNELANSIIDSELFRNLPNYLACKDKQKILLGKPDVLIGLILLFVEVIKRRSSSFTKDYSKTLNLVLDMITEMNSINARQAEDVLSVLINFSYDDQIDKVINLEKKIKAYNHCLTIIAPHNWSNRIQIRFLFWGFQNEIKKARSANELIRQSLDTYYQKFKTAEKKLLDHKSELETKSMNDDIFKLTSKCFEFFMGVYGTFFVYMRDLSDAFLKNLSKDITYLVDKMMEISTSPLILFIPNEFCSRYQYYNFGDAFKSSDDKKILLFKSFLRHFEMLNTDIVENMGFNFQLDNLQYIIEHIQHWNPEKCSYNFFNKFLFSANDYKILLLIHLTIRIRKLFFFWNSQLFKKENEVDIYSRIEKIIPNIVKIILRFEFCIYHGLCDGKTTDRSRQLIPEWKAFFDTVWEGVIFITRIFGVSSKDLVKQAYSFYISEINKAIASLDLNFEIKLLLSLGFKFRKISEHTELSKKLGVYNIDEFFQNIFFENQGLESLCNLLGEIMRKNATLTESEEEFMTGLIEFFSLFEPSSEVEYEKTLLKILSNFDDQSNIPKIKTLRLKISFAVLKQLEHKESRILNINKEIHEIKYRKKRCIIKKNEYIESKGQDDQMQKIEADINYLKEVECTLQTRNTKLIASQKEYSAKFLEIAQDILFQVFQQYDRITSFSAEKLVELGLEFKEKKQQKFQEELENCKKYNSNLLNELNQAKFDPHFLLRAEKFSETIIEYDSTAKTHMNFFSKTCLGNKMSSELGFTWKSYSSWWKKENSSLVFENIFFFLQSYHMTSIPKEYNYFMDRMLIATNLAVNCIMTTLYYSNYYNELQKDEFYKQIEYLISIGQILSALHDSINIKNSKQLAQTKELLFKISQLLYNLDEKRALKFFGDIKLEALLDDSNPFESSRKRSFLFNMWRKGISTETQIEILLKQISNHSSKLLVSDFEKYFANYPTEDVTFILDQNRSLINLDRKREAINLESISNMKIADLKYIRENFMDHPKSYFDLYINFLIKNYKSKYNSIFGPVKSETSCNYQDYWLELITILKEFPYLVPYLSFRILPKDENMKELGLHMKLQNVSIIEFLFREPLFIENVSLWYFLKEFLILSKPFSSFIEGQEISYHEIATYRILLSIKEIISTEIQRLSVFEDSTLLERLVTISTIMRKIKDEISRNELWDFYNSILKMILRLIRISFKKNFKCYRVILNSTLWSEINQMLKQLNDTRGIKKSEKDTFYFDLIENKRDFQESITSIPLLDRLIQENSFDDEFSVQNNPTKINGTIDKMKFYSGYNCTNSNQIHKDNEFIEKIRDRMKTVKKFYIDAGFDQTSNFLNDSRIKKHEDFSMKCEIENLADDLRERDSRGVLKGLILSKSSSSDISSDIDQQTLDPKSSGELSIPPLLSIYHTSASLGKIDVIEKIELNIEMPFNYEKVHKSSRFQFFSRSSIKSRDEFDQAVNVNKHRMKLFFEGSLVELQSASLFEQKKFRLEDLERFYNFNDNFSKSCLILFFRDYLSEFMSEDLRIQSDIIFQEYQDVLSNFSDYLKSNTNLANCITMDQESMAIESVIVNPGDSYQEKKDDFGSLALKSNKLFDLLSKVTFYSEDPNFSKQPFSKRKSSNVKKLSKNVMESDLKSRLGNMIIFSEGDVLDLLIPFLHDYKEGWPYDNFNDMIKELLNDPLNEIRLFDLLFFICYVPQAINDPSIQELLSVTDIKLSPKIYISLLENFIIFLNDYFESNKPNFFSLPLSTISEFSFDFVDDLKSKYEFNKLFKTTSKGADLVFGLVNIPIIQQNCLKSFSLIKFFEKLTIIDPPNLKLPTKHWISSKNIVSLFALIKIHFENHFAIKDEISRVFQLFVEFPENFPGILNALIQILELELSQTVTFLKESVQTIRSKCKNQENILHFECPASYFPSFVIIEIVLKILSTFFLRVMFEASFSQKANSKKPISRELMGVLEDSLGQLLENLKTQAVIDYMLDIYHFLELIYKRQSGIPNNLILNLVSVGVSYSLLYVAEEHIGEKASSLIDDDFPTLVQVISQDDYSELPNLENIGSFTKIREKSDLDFNLIFSNFGLKYSSEISKLAKEPNGTMREEIWHLNHKFPWIFEFSTKKEIFKKIFREFIPDSEAREKIVIDRENAMRDFLKHSSVTKKNDLLKTLSITFQGEAGIDDGGLRREFYKLIADQLFNPDFGLFQLSANNQSIEPTSSARMIPYHLKLLEFAGITIAKAIIDDINIGVTFTKYFLKHILGRNLSLADLQDVDPDLANGLQFVLDNDIEDIGLTFTYERKIFDKSYLTELLPGGVDISVTNANKKEYVRKFCQAKMVREKEVEIQAFVKGFRSLLPVGYISYFSPTELGLMIAGIQEINLLEVKTNCIYLNCNQETTIVVWFWEILEEFTNDELSSFIFFISGSTKLPYGGGKLIPLKLRKSNSSAESLPVAHTCYFEIELPDYPSKEILREKLLLGIYEGKEGFHIIFDYLNSKIFQVEI